MPCMLTASLSNHYTVRTFAQFSMWAIAQSPQGIRFLLSACMVSQGRWSPLLSQYAWPRTTGDIREQFLAMVPPETIDYLNNHKEIRYICRLLS